MFIHHCNVNIISDEEACLTQKIAITVNPEQCRQIHKNPLDFRCFLLVFEGWNVLASYAF